MSSFGTALCIDAPDEEGLRSIAAPLRLSVDRPDLTFGAMTVAPDGLFRLLIYFDYEPSVHHLVEDVVDRLQEGRVAEAENGDEFGAEWLASSISRGVCTPVHQHEVTNLDPDVTVAHDPIALASLARLYNVEPAALSGAATAADSAYRHLQTIGDPSLFPFWFACGIPWPYRGDLPALPLDTESC